MLTVCDRMRKAGLSAGRKIWFTGRAPVVVQDVVGPVFGIFDGARLAQEWVSLEILGTEGGVRAEAIVEVVH